MYGVDKQYILKKCPYLLNVDKQYILKKCPYLLNEMISTAHQLFIYDQAGRGIDLLG